MKLPRFSLRELLMLMTICALLMPYVYSCAFTTPRLGLSVKTVLGMVAKVEPAATIQSATIKSSSGRDEQIELTCLIPTAKSDAFFAKLHAAIDEHIDDSGWINLEEGTSGTNGSLTGFSYDLVNGSSRCAVVGILVDNKDGNDRLNNRDVNKVRFIILSPHVP